MIKVYPAIIHQEEGAYWAEFPDLEGCFTDGQTLEEVISMAQESLGGYLASLLDRGQQLPKASDILAINSNDGQKTYVSVDVDAYRRDTKAVKKMVSLPAWLVKEADAQSISLSKVMQDALKVRLGIT